MKLTRLQRKKFRIRNKIKKNSKLDRFRISVYRSSKNISAQIIDDFNIPRAGNRGNNYAEEAGSLHGWYKVPTLSQIEAWIYDSTADTPNGDPVEPDHPDSWLHLLGAC